jgi:hypothetical protein
MAEDPLPQMGDGVSWSCPKAAALAMRIGLNGKFLLQPNVKICKMSLSKAIIQSTLMTVIVGKFEKQIDQKGRSLSICFQIKGQH